MVSAERGDVRVRLSALIILSLSLAALLLSGLIWLEWLMGWR